MLSQAFCLGYNRKYMKQRYGKFIAIPEDKKKKIGRNERCPCGSGLKYKRCCLIKKPRNTSVIMDFGKPTKIR